MQPGYDRCIDRFAYVTIREHAGAGAEYLGQITAQDVAFRDGPEYGITISADTSALIVRATTESNFVDRVRIRFVQGTGHILGRVIGQSIQRTTEKNAFEEATLDLASTETIALYLSGVPRPTSDPHVDIGYALRAEPGQARVQLQPAGFRRHTFMCGQSRSGKTFALGVVLEQLLLSGDTTRIVVLDPNSDFVRLNEIRTKAAHDAVRHRPSSDSEYDALKANYDKVRAAIRIRRPSSTGSSPLRIRLSDLSRDEQGALLQLHPIRDLQAFNAFSGVIQKLSGDLYSWEVVNDELKRNFSGTAVDLALRIQNLRLAEWTVWCKTMEPSIAQELAKDDWRCLVVDVGTLESAEQRIVASLAVLNHLWTVRDREKPVLLVLDEAHNICPHEPSHPTEEILTNYIIRIAGEGLKYGLRLLLVSQRPAKIHASVLSQCENLILMRMNSQADLESLVPMFSQVPRTLIAQSAYFAQGDSLILGEIVKSPTFATFEGRISLEGGGDARIR